MNANFCYILGSGPSLSDFDWEKVNQDLVIGLNSLIFDDNFNKATNKILAFHDERFLSEVNFINNIKDIKNKYPIITTKYNSKKLREIWKLEILDIEKYILDIEIYRQYTDEFRMPSDLLRNAAFEIGIPLALGIGATKIKMYGCSFDYGMDIKKEPDYYSGAKFQSFEQTQESAKKWAEFSKKRFQSLLNWCESRNIEIIKI